MPPDKERARRGNGEPVELEKAKPLSSAIPSPSAQRTPATFERPDVQPVYRALILDPARRMLAMGLPFDKASEFCGLPDRFLSKALNPDTPSGRQMTWRSMQVFFDLVYPDGFCIRVEPRPGPKFDALSLRYATRYGKQFQDPKSRYELLRDWGKCGGLKKRELPQAELQKIARRLARARKRKIPAAKRIKLASNASRARWLRHREQQKNRGAKT